MTYQDWQLHLAATREAGPLQDMFLDWAVDRGHLLWQVLALQDALLVARGEAPWQQDTE